MPSFHQTARRFWAMEKGFQARERGLPIEAKPDKMTADEWAWWVAGWRWKDDQLEVARLRVENERLQRLIEGGR